MIMSSRQNPPRMPLRRNPPSNSSASSKFTLGSLIETPPPSPALPSMSSARGKPTKSRRLRSLRHLLRWVMLLCVFGLLLAVLRGRIPSHQVASIALDTSDLLLPSSDGGPTPVVLIDENGRTRWTISWPPMQELPLSPVAYAELSLRSERVSGKLSSSGHKVSNIGHSSVDKTFLDVAEAEKRGFLALPPGASDHNQIRPGTSKPCQRSLTYVLGAADVGLGESLMGLFLAYGLAKKEGRVFFLDDSKWAYGRFTAYFSPLPAASCSPPPMRHRVPFPLHAAHIVVSTATFPWTFGKFLDGSDSNSWHSSAQSEAFTFARTGYEDLFHLNEVDASYARTRSVDIKGLAQTRHVATVGVHVRRGDLHPLELIYHDSYIPLEMYADKARSYNTNQQDATGARLGSIIVASDDPDVYGSAEFHSAMRAQELIRLASKNTMQGSSKNRYIDEDIGWEGGFFPDFFKSLGQPTVAATTLAPSVRRRLEHDDDSEPAPSGLALNLRELVGRAYLLDLAVLAESDYVVCAVSATGCRLLAVMMGWDKAIGQKRWNNIDGKGGWTSMPMPYAT